MVSFGSAGVMICYEFFTDIAQCCRNMSSQTLRVLTNTPRMGDTLK